MNIVVVDDEEDLLELVRVVLEDEGYQVHSFARPTAAMQLRDADERPDLFLIDIMLPEMTGIELAKRLTDGGFGATPKIAMSASRERVAEATRSALFAGAISKPFEIADLLDRVEQHTAH